MCQDQIPALTPEAAADRLAARYDVPELTAGLLDREPTRDHGRYLKTTPGPFVRQSPRPDRWLSTEPGTYVDPAHFAGLINL